MKYSEKPIIYENGEIIKVEDYYVWQYCNYELRIMLSASSVDMLKFKIGTFLAFDKAILSKTEVIDKQRKLLTVNTKKISDFTSGEGESMPPKYSDGSFRVRPNGLIEYRFMHIDNTRHSVYGHSKNECYDKRTKLMSNKEKIKTKKISPTLDEWIEKWFSLFRENKNGEQWNKTTLYLIEKYIKPKIGKKQISLINGIELQEIINGLSSTPNTQKKVMQILNACLKKASKLRLINFNPMETVERNSYKAVSYRALQLNEQQKLYEACTDLKYKQIFFFCCCTGIRVSRALELQYSDFDFRRRQIKVFKKQYKGLNEYYYVPFLEELLKGLPKEGKIFKDLTYESVKTYFRRAYARTKITGANQHSWRHTFISNCNHIQIPYKTIQTWAGHNTLAMTMDTYTELLTDENSVILDYIRKLKDNFVPKLNYDPLS